MWHFLGKFIKPRVAFKIFVLYFVLMVGGIASVHHHSVSFREVWHHRQVRYCLITGAVTSRLEVARSCLDPYFSLELMAPMGPRLDLTLACWEMWSFESLTFELVS